MKKITYILLLALVTMASCSRDKLNEQSIFIDPVPNPVTAYTTHLDKWLQHNFLEPYSCNMIYRLDDNTIGDNTNYNIVPVRLGKADTLAHLAVYLWYDVYDKIVPEQEHAETHAWGRFIKHYGPKNIQLIGSSMINAASGTEKLGYASGGTKITLLKINAMETDNIDQLNEYVFKTMHHEFSHILHQKRTRPVEFNHITPADYNPSAWQKTPDTTAWKLGFASNYATSGENEDFVEIIANYITNNDSVWQMKRDWAQKGGRLPQFEKKYEICKNWLMEAYKYDLDAMRAEVQERQNNITSRWEFIMSIGAPKVTLKADKATVKAGENMVLTAELDHFAPETYVWYESKDGGENTEIYSGSEPKLTYAPKDAGAYTYTLLATEKDYETVEATIDITVQ